jgi:hypothetical protein
MKKVLMTYAVRKTIPVELSDEEYEALHDYGSDRIGKLFLMLEDTVKMIDNTGTYEEMSFKILEEDGFLIAES